MSFRNPITSEICPYTAILPKRHDEAFARARGGDKTWHPQPLSREDRKSSGYSIGGTETQSV